MSISLECPSCMNTFSLPDTMAGRKSKCPECQFTVFVPRGENAVDAAPATPTPAPKADAVPKVTAAPMKKKSRAAVKKPTATTATVPPRSDNPFAFDNKPSPGRSGRRRGRGLGMIVVVVLLLLGLGGLLLVGGAAGVGWYLYNQAAQQRQLAEASAQLAQQQLAEAKTAPERVAETKKIDINDNKNDPANDPPQNGRLVISCSPIPANVKPGDQVPVNITVQRQNCQGDVQLALEDPKGILVVSYSSKLAAGADRIPATVAIAPDTKNGVYSLKVTATLNGLTDVKTLEFKVENSMVVKVPPPPAPEIAPLQFLGGAQIQMQTHQWQGKPDSEMLCVALSRDQKIAVFGGRDRLVHVWDMTEKKQRFAFEGHAAFVSAVAISADGNTLASGDADGDIRLWDAATGKEKQRLKAELLPGEKLLPNRQRIKSLDFAPLGDTLLACNDTGLRCWSVAGGKQLSGVVGPHSGGKFEPNAAFACSLSNGKIATYNLLKMQEQVYDATADLFAFAPGKGGLFVVDNGGPKVEFSHYVLGMKKVPLASAPNLERGDAPTCLALADKAEFAVTGDAKGVIHGLELLTGKELFRATAHQGAIHGIAVSADGRMIVSCGHDGNVSFTELSNGKPGEPPPVAKGQLMLAPLPAQTVKAGGSGKMNVQVVRKDCKGDVRVAVVPPPNIVQVAAATTLPANSEQIEIPFTVAANAIPGKYTIQVTVSLDALSDTKPFELTIDKAGEPDKPALQLSAKILYETKVYKKHAVSVDCVALSPDKKSALSGGADGKVLRWNTEKEEEPKTMYTGQFGVSAVAISPDGKWIAFGDVRGTVRLLSADGKETRPLTLDKIPEATKRLINRINALEFSSKSDVLVAGTAKYFGCWSVETGKQTQALGTVADSASVHFAADDTNVYALNGVSLAVVNARVGAPLAFLGKPGVKPAEFRATFFDVYPAKQELIAVVKKDKMGELQRINVLTGQAQKLADFDKPDEIPLRLAVADHAGFVLTGDKQGTIRLLEIDSGREVLQTKQHKGVVHALAVSADGRMAVSGLADGTVGFYYLRNEKP